MSEKTLAILGSGPGIATAVAQAFSTRGFTHVALVSRNSTRLEQDREAVLNVIKDNGGASTCQVKTFACDLADFKQLKDTLSAIEQFGSLECVLFNAARVAGQPPVQESTEAIELDFRLTNLALYETAKWALPILEKVTSDERSPSFFVTSSFLWKEPVPPLMSLSAVKSAQRAMVLSLHAYYGEKIHIGLVSVGGPVSPEAKTLTPKKIADAVYSMYEQPRGKWERDIELPE